MTDIPGHLQPIYSPSRYLDLLYKSRMSSDAKLAGTLVARTCSISKKDNLQISAITPYAMSRVLNLSQHTCEQLLDDLVKYGWLFDTGRRVGARRMYALTFSLLPLGEPKK